MTQDSAEERCRKHMAVMDDKRKIEELEAKLKTSEEIGRAFEEDAGQLRAKLAKAVNVIKNLINLAPEGDEDEWHIALDDAAEALAEIKGN
jgi:biopolymer transport protein ExbB/TolQ